MNSNDIKIRLTFDEPWDLSKSIEGIIINRHRTSEGGNYFLIEDEVTKESYVISARYVGYDIEDIFSGKAVIVAIAQPKNEIISFDNLNFVSDLSYIAIGHIEISIR